MRHYGSIRRGELRRLELDVNNNGLLAVGVIAAKAMLLSIIFGAFLMTIMFQARMATAANLKSLSTVETDLLRVGDIFDQADGKEDVVIGRAPQPGNDMTLNARTLMRIARATNVAWTPQSALDQVIVRREATLVDLNNIHDVLSKALSEKGVGSKLDIVIKNTLPQITLPKSEAPTIEVKSLRYMPQHNSFEAVLVAPSVDKPLKTIAINGVVHKRIMIPVLNAPIKSGDIIGASDITYIDVRQGDMPNGALVQIADIQGMAAAKPLSAGKPIRNTDIALPRLVDRGGFVTIIYKDGPIALSAKGKALQNGAKGEMVRILNISSNKHLQGMVTADQQVTIY